MTTVGATRGVVQRLLAATGLGDENAAATAEAIVLAEVWGRRSHGLLRVPYYLTRLSAGGYDPAAVLTVLHDTGPLVAYDGKGGIGHWQVHAAATVAAQRAAEHGIAAVSVANSGHCGALGVYLLPIIDAGLGGLVFSNGPAVMPPWGGNQPVLSTSPLAAGFLIDGQPAIVDLASTAVARGTIAARAAAGEALPDGWALDADGQPTTDATAALSGMLAPLGGAKGFALAFAVECLTGALVGPALSIDIADIFDDTQAANPQRIAHLVLAIDPRSLDPSDSSQDRLSALAAAVHAGGGRVPGAARPHPRAVADDEELVINGDVAAQLREWCARLDVDP